MSKDTVRRVLEAARDQAIIDLGRQERMKQALRDHQFRSLDCLLRRTCQDIAELETALEAGWLP